jgi:hypothetical protein
MDAIEEQLQMFDRFIGKNAVLANASRPDAAIVIAFLDAAEARLGWRLVSVVRDVENHGYWYFFRRNL